MKRIKLGFIVGVLFTMIAFVAITPASAGFETNGILFEQTVDPGQSVEHMVTIKSGETDPPADFTTEIFGYGHDLQDGRMDLRADTDVSPYTARPFLEFSPASFHLDPGESQELILKCEIPSSAEGGLYARARIRSAPLNDEGNIGIAVGFTIPVRLTVSGSEPIETGEITSLDVNDSDSGKIVSVIIKNTGNHHYMAEAEAVLKDENGDVVSTVSAPLLAAPIIPTYSRQFSLVPETDLAPGTYTVEATVTLEDGTVLDTEEATFEV